LNKTAYNVRIYTDWGYDECIRVLMTDTEYELVQNIAERFLGLNENFNALVIEVSKVCCDGDDNIDFLPCPFCGDKRFAKIISNRDLRGEECMEGRSLMYTVVCDASSPSWASKRGCGASCGYQDTQEAAVREWNRRADV
jgi:hypothetical protein